MSRRPKHGRWPTIQPGGLTPRRPGRRWQDAPRPLGPRRPRPPTRGPSGGGKSGCGWRPLAWLSLGLLVLVLYVKAKNGG